MQKTKLPNLITILILTLITVLMWIGFSIYRAFTTTVEPSVPTNISQALVPALDTTTINAVESALFFNESQIPQLTFSSTPSATLVPVATPTPISTPIASPSAIQTQTATPSATPIVP